MARLWHIVGAAFSMDQQALERHTHIHAGALVIHGKRPRRRGDVVVAVVIPWWFRGAFERD